MVVTGGAAGDLAVIIGAGGRLGRCLSAEFGRAGVAVAALTHDQLDVTDHAAVAGRVTELRPTVVVNCAAWTDVQRCEADPAGATAINTDAIGNLAGVCDRVGAHLVQLSTDYVFDGTSERPYDESDEPNPVSVYGATKLGGERLVGANATVARLSWIFGPRTTSVIRSMVDQATTPGAVLSYVDDRWGSPSNVEMVTPVLVRLALERPGGLIHIANTGCATYHDVAEYIVSRVGAPGVTVVRSKAADYETLARRPRVSALSSSRMTELGYPSMPAWTEAVESMLESVQAVRGSA